jgi:hypothetical protein
MQLAVEPRTSRIRSACDIIVNCSIPHGISTAMLKRILKFIYVSTRFIPNRIMGFSEYSDVKLVN